MIAVNDEKYKFALETIDIRLDEEGRPHVYRGGREIPQFDHHGYKVVSLTCGGKTTQCLVHHLAALKFIPNDDPARKRYIDHVNAVKSDNRISNLRWVTHSGNMSNEITRAQHSKAIRAYYETADKEKVSAIRKAVANRPGMKEKRSLITKSVMSRPGMREMLSGLKDSKKLAVEQIDIETGTVLAVYEGLRAAEYATGVPHGNIARVCRGQMGVTQAGGYGWRFKVSDPVSEAQKQ